jgi:UDP-perosamine 4-acetyltransferase
MSRSLQVVGLGAGGHARVVLEIVSAMADVEVVGLLDPSPTLQGAFVFGVPVLGDDRLLPSLRERGVSAVFIGVGSVRDTAIRKRLYECAIAHQLGVVDAIHATAIVSRSATTGHGITLLARSILNAGARIGDNVLVNTGAIVEHDVIVGDHVHVASGACLGGAVRVGDGAHIGLGAVVRQGVEIGAGSVVGAGAVVVADVPPGVTVAGVPARVLRAAAGEAI